MNRKRKFFSEKYDWTKPQLNEIKYHVSQDLQGGSFAMGVDFTIEQWCYQAMDWCWIDENYELLDYFAKAPATLNTLYEISEIWCIKFRKTRSDKREKT